VVSKLIDTEVQLPISRRPPLALSPTHTRPRPFQAKLVMVAMFQSSS